MLMYQISVLEARKNRTEVVGVFGPKEGRREKGKGRREK
jgi:hypothetical protein